jgi:hypothetical protein
MYFKHFGQVLRTSTYEVVVVVRTTILEVVLVRSTSKKRNTKSTTVVPLNEYFKKLQSDGAVVKRQIVSHGIFNYFLWII